MTTETDRSPIDAWAVAIDETDHYCIDDEDRPHIKAIYGVYLLDRNERVHCCEMAPSHYLIHLYDQIVPADNTPDEVRDRLSDKYGNEGGDNCYMHCRDIDRMIAEAETCGGDFPWPACHIGATDVSYEDVPHDEQMESLREHYASNWPL